jgi:hypothetical protein
VSEGQPPVSLDCEPVDDEARAADSSIVDEGAWVYLIAAGGRDGGPLHEHIAQACEAGGWPAIGLPDGEADGFRDPGRLFESVSHAVAHADLVVALLGDRGETTDAELALAYSHRRPIVGVRVGADPSASGIESMLEGYERARVISCADAEECATRLRAVLSDPDFSETVRLAAGELATDA